MKWFLKAVVLTLVASSPATAASGIGRVTLLIPSSSSYNFRTDGARTSLPSCASNTPTQWAIDMSTPSGQGIAASIISAFMVGKSISVMGTGTCPTVQPDVEAVLYVVVNP